MASITITVPDNVVGDVLDAFAAKYGRTDIVNNPAWVNDGNGTDPDSNGEPRRIVNPETKAQFAKRMVAQFIKKTYRDHRTDIHKAAMMAAINADDVNVVDVS